jgi:hypothetical protein
MSEISYTIQNDVLLTESNIAFLIGGNHSVLDFITGKKKPTPASFLNFQNNVATRAHIAKLCRCKYLHVIFPDKQSVLTEEFPIKKTVRLGDLYTRMIFGSPLEKLVLFPAYNLKATKEKNCYQKLDTHLSDYGSLIVLKNILKKIDEPANDALEELETLIVHPKVSHGDLGGKLTPKAVQESIHLKTNWNYRHFSSNGSFNNGQIDIYFSPDAPIKKKLLIFGDSFYRLMLVHFSRVFSEIVFLRTPYLHAEMVQLIKPDIILTGNSERYLADVSPDSNAPAFQMYSYSHNSTSKPSGNFINAFRTVTSPTAISSKKYVDQVFNEHLQSKMMIGPSHIVRWGEHLKANLLDRPASLKDLIGYGGAPIWSKKLFDAAVRDAHPDAKILLMVGDFRFGNEVCLKPSPDAPPVFASGLSGINAKAISATNDALMLKKSIQALELWNDKFNNNIRLLFWDLFCRQVQDRLAGRHISEKKYVHPSWNLLPIQAMFPANRVIDLTPLLNLPMHEAMRLFIDGSSHPSYIGYLFITNCFFHESNAITSYNKACFDVESMIFSAIKSLIARRQSAVTLFGRSVWIDTLLRYLGPSGRKKAQDLGLSIAPINVQIGHKIDSRQIIENTNKSHLFLVCENGCLSDLPVFGDVISPQPNGVHPGLNALAWEASCSEVITQRNETPRALHGTVIGKPSPNQIIQLSNADVELGPFGYPTINGIIKVLNLM